MVISIITYSLDKLLFNTLAITLNNMSMQGTWCDALFVQAVADCQNVAIDIIESQENFAWETLI